MMIAFRLLLASSAAWWSTMGFAQISSPITPFTGSFVSVDCDPAPTSPGLSRQSSDSCATANASGAAFASPSLLRSKTEVAANGQPSEFENAGNYRSSAQFTDGFIVSPSNLQFLDKAGTLSFTYDIDGSISDHRGNDFIFGVIESYSSDGLQFLGRYGTGIYDVRLTRSDGSLISAVTGARPDSRISFPQFAPTGALSTVGLLDGAVTFNFAVTFGQAFNYSTFLRTGAGQQGAFVGFYDTAILRNLVARDASGNIVDVQLVSAAGADYSGVLQGSGNNQTPGVPEPATWALLITGFGLVGGAARRSKLRQITTV